uniref:Ubiquitin-like domain-containing protein n=1 Tax=Gopherus agassizii TaxID=38772 RepID=A0A452HXG4_9SAUR
MGLYQTLAEELDTFISNDLQPNRVFKTQISTAIHTIFLFLTQNCFRNSGSAGSSGKGTALKDVSDVDLVVFVSSITDFRALKAERKKIIAEIQTRLEECRASLGKDLVLSIKKTKWENPRVLTFTLTSSTTDEHIDFVVLPAFDALGQLYRGYKPDPQVYLRLTESDPEGSEFSPCFTELQRNFIMALPTKLKSLIRLVKRWYKQVRQLHKLPIYPGEGPAYTLELLSVYAWEQGSRDPAFNMAEGFRTVLELIRQHAQLCVYWTINYGFENETLKRYLKSQLCKPRPIILDPADPTGIVGQGSRWDLVAQEAKHCCGQQCCWKHNGSAVQPWNVPVRAGFPAMAHIVSKSKTAKIAKQTGVSPYQQKLACQNGAYVELRDDSRLSDYQLKTGDVVLLVVKNEEPITIFVKNDKGRTSTYTVLPSDGVTQFKGRVQQQENIQAEQFWLNFEGKPLEDGHKLGDYNIAPHCTIFLHLRLRGG